MSSELGKTHAELDRLVSSIDSADSRDDALANAISAAETCLKALKLTNEPRAKSGLKVQFEDLMKRAESIKKQPDSWVSPNGSNPRKSNISVGTVQEALKTTRDKNFAASNQLKSTRSLSKAEQIIVLRSSELNGNKFPPWTSVPQPTDFQLDSGGKRFMQTPELELSPDQLDQLDSWKSVSEAFTPANFLVTDPTFDANLTQSNLIDLVQDIATDCSVIAGLCAAVACCRYDDTALKADIMFPLSMSPNGKYIFRFNFNGSFRRVVIDDRLPVSKSSRALHVVDRNNPGAFWPALFEKAYLKVRGGYAFPGSNPSTDLWIITGWIPEQIFVRDENVDVELLWTRIKHGFHAQDVFITLGTGRMSRKIERSLGLAEHHAYAVLDVREEDDRKLLLIKNPWTEAAVKQANIGRARANTGSSTRSDDGADEASLSLKLSALIQVNGSQRVTGTFWADLNQVMQNFDSIHLNWRPGTFSHRQDIHFNWDLTSSTTCSVAKTPQFRVSCQRAGEIWILLCRHFKSTTKHVSEPRSVPTFNHDPAKGHIGLSVYEHDGQRVYLRDGAMESGPDVDSPQTLLRINNVQHGDVLTVVPTQDALAPLQHTFTLSAFGHGPLTFETATTRFRYSEDISAMWTVGSAGGNQDYASYSQNPQFTLVLTKSTSINILLETREPSLNVQVKLVHSSGGRRVVTAPKARDIVCDSGQFRRQSCLASRERLDPGTYTMIAATFEPDQLGHFTISVYSTEPVSARMLPGENAGKICFEFPPAMFPTTINSIACLMKPKKLLRASFVARYLPPASVVTQQQCRAGLRLSVQLGRGPNRRTILMSNDGEFVDAVGSVRTEDIDLSPEMLKDGEMSVVLERLAAHSQNVGFHAEQYVVQIWMADIADPSTVLVYGKNWMEWEEQD